MHEVVRPVVGVLVSPRIMGKLGGQRPHPRLVSLQTASERKRLTLAFFSIANVNLSAGRIHAIIYNRKTSRWQFQWLPLPDVVYFRGGSPSHYRNKKQQFIAKLKSEGKHLLNYPSFDKWKVYRILQAHPLLRKYLPHTELLSEPKLKRMLDNKEVVYLKAAKGRKGQKVMKLKRLPDRSYWYSYYRSYLLSSGELVRKHHSNWSHFYNEIAQFFAGKEVIMQEAIDVLTIQGRPVDLRAELQRNGQGELEVLAICIRLGAFRSPITTHAEAMPFDDFFENRLGYSPNKVRDLKGRLHHILTLVYKAVEAQYGSYSEMGIDLAIDTSGHIWFIECNSQSTKVSLQKAYYATAYQCSFANTLDYALCLYQR